MFTEEISVLTKWRIGNESRLGEIDICNKLYGAGTKMIQNFRSEGEIYKNNYEQIFLCTLTKNNFTLNNILYNFGEL